MLFIAVVCPYTAILNVHATLPACVRDEYCRSEPGMYVGQVPKAKIEGKIVFTLDSPLGNRQS